MTLIDAPYELEVHWLECPAATATFEHLNRQATPYRAVLITQAERRVLARYGHHVIPTVILWRGAGQYRHRYMSFDGYNPGALRTIHRILTEAASAAQLKEPA